MLSDVKIKQNYFTYEEQMRYEDLKDRPWISIAEKLPRDGWCVEVAAHQYYGLANWTDEKGFTEIFMTQGPSEHAEHYKNHTHPNENVMYWREICSWPYYGTQGQDADTMQKYM
jgi:hypothetical protein